MDEVFTPRELAVMLKTSVSTLARWRAEGKGPPFQKLGDGPRARVRYRASAVEAWRNAK